MSFRGFNRGQGQRGGDRGGRGGGGERGGGFRGGRGDQGGGFRGGDRGRGGGRGRGGRGGRVRYDGPPVFRDPDPNVPAPGPDVRTLDIENAFAESTSGINALGNLSMSNQFPVRPGFGTLGRKVLVYANYFEINIKPDLVLTRYNVEIAPDESGKTKKKRRVIQLLLEQPTFAGVLTDFGSIIVSAQPLNIQIGQTFRVTYRGDGEDTPLPNAQVYTCRVVAPTSLSIADYVGYLASKLLVPVYAQQLEIIQALNAVIAFHPRSNGEITSIGQNRHFSMDHSPRMAHNIKVIDGGLEVLRGFFESVRPATGRLLLNVNVSHGVFWEPLPLDQLLPKMGSGNLDTLHKKLRHTRIEVTHLPAKKNKKNKVVPRCKSISGLATTQDGKEEAHPPRVRRKGGGPKDVEFWYADVPPAAANAGAKPSKKPSTSRLPTNAYVSVWDYFHATYPEWVRNSNMKAHLPVLNVGSVGKPSYLPAEACKMLPGNPAKRRLSPDQTQELTDYAIRKPVQNAHSIVSDGKALLGLKQPALSNLIEYGVKIGPGLITVASRVLPPPAIKYKDQYSKETSVRVENGSWNLKDVKFHTGVNLGPWTYLRIRWQGTHVAFTSIPADAIYQEVIEFKKFLKKSGINSDGFYAEPKSHPLDLFDGQLKDNNARIEQRLKEISSRLPEPRFLLVLLQARHTEIYNAVKTIADTTVGIHTVGCVLKNFMPKPDGRAPLQYFGNVSLKFNCKGGGINQTLDAPKLQLISEGKTMVVGIDVTHPSPGSRENAPSVAAIVASVDRFLGQWPGTFTTQTSRQEMVDSLERMFISRLRLWEQRTKSKLPENIIIYRDGVSEGQYQTVLDQELTLIRNACRQVYPPEATQKEFPKIAFIVCGKRHHTRFYPANTENLDNRMNCVPGTVVDRGVTEARTWDFYLQPHAALEGTARPCHYIVILDEIFRRRPIKPPYRNTADALEDLTLAMCHLWARATKSVSLCPAAYYADILCTRTRCYFQDQFAPNEDASSVAASSVSGVPNAPFDAAIQIHPKLAHSMFYV